MPINKKWSDYTPENVAEAPDVFGVYEIANRLKNVIYIGEGNIKERLASHLRPKSPDYFSNASYFRYETTGGKAKAVAAQNVLLKFYKTVNDRLPEHNVYERG